MPRCGATGTPGRRRWCSRARTSPATPTAATPGHCSGNWPADRRDRGPGRVRRTPQHPGSGRISRGGQPWFDDPHGTCDYDPTRAYAQSKPASLLFTLELQRRPTLAGSPVRALAARPGRSSTNLQSHVGNPPASLSTPIGDKVVAQDPRAGVLPTPYAAT